MKNRITDDNNLPPNITELVTAYKVSYLGFGFGINGFKLKIKGIRKEFYISHEKLKELSAIKKYHLQHHIEKRVDTSRTNSF